MAGHWRVLLVLVRRWRNFLPALPAANRQAGRAMWNFGVNLASGPIEYQVGRINPGHRGGAGGNGSIQIVLHNALQLSIFCP